MKITIILLTLIMLSNSLIVGQISINGWDKTKWGMTKDEIKTIYGDKIVDENKDINNTIIDNNLIIITNIDTFKFQTELVFDNYNKLNKVCLMSKFENMHWLEIASVESIFNEKLIQKYKKQPDYEFSPDDVEDVMLWHKEWWLDNTKIELVCVVFSPLKSGIITITYIPIDNSGL